MKLRLPNAFKRILLLSMAAFSYTVQVSGAEMARLERGVVFTYTPAVNAALEKTSVVGNETRNDDEEPALGEGESLATQVAMNEGITDEDDPFSLRADFTYFRVAEEPVLLKPGRLHTGNLTMARHAVVPHKTEKFGKARRARSVTHDTAYYYMQNALNDVLGGDVDDDDELTDGEVIYVEHRGKGVVRRRKKYIGKLLALWNDPAFFFGGGMTLIYLHDGYSSFWTTSIEERRAYARAEAAALAQNATTTANTKPQYAHAAVAAPAFGGFGGFGGYTPSHSAGSYVAPSPSGPVTGNGSYTLAGNSFRATSGALGSAQPLNAREFSLNGSSTSFTVKNGGSLNAERISLEDGATLINNSSAPLTLNPQAATSLAVQGGSATLNGDWLLDLSRDFTLDMGAAEGPLVIGNGTLSLVHAADGKGLTLNLANRWDGASSGRFDLFMLGSGGKLNIDGSSVADVRITDVFSAINLNYTGADGGKNSLNLCDDALPGNLAYSFEYKYGMLSLVAQQITAPSAPVAAPEAPVLAPAVNNNAPSFVAEAAPLDVPTRAAGSNFTWNAGQGDLTWQKDAAWGSQGTYTAKDNVSFTSDGVAGKGTINVGLGSDITSGNITITGEDDVVIDLNNHTFTLGGDIIKTENGTLNIKNASDRNNTSGGGMLTFQNGTFNAPNTTGVSGNIITIRADYLTFKNVDMTVLNDPNYTPESPNDIATKHNSILIDTHGSFTMDGGSGTFYKINALYDGWSKETTVTFTNGAIATFIRGEQGDFTTTNTSALEAHTLNITNGAKLSTTKQDSVKAFYINIDGEGSELSLRTPVIKPLDGSSTGETHLSMSNGATLNSSNATYALNTTQSNNKLDLYLSGTTSYITGRWTLTLANTNEIVIGSDGQGGNSYLTIGKTDRTGSVNITAGAACRLVLEDGVYQAGQTDYTLFKVSEGSTLTLVGAAMQEYKDYLSTTKIATIKAGDTTLTNNDNYLVYFIRKGDEVALRVIDKQNSPTEYIWGNNDGAEMAWSSISWGNGAYYVPTTGAAPTVKFVSDNQAGVANTAVSLKSAVTAGDMLVSGEDDFTFQLGSNKLTLDHLGKSGSGALVLNGNKLTGANKNITVDHTVDITGGTFELGANMALTTEEIHVDGEGTRFVLAEGATLTPLPGAGHLYLTNGATLTSTTQGTRAFAANYITTGGETIYMTGDWSLNVGGVNTLTFGQGANGDAAYITVGKGSETGSVDLTSANVLSEFRITDATWDPANRTDYTLFKVAEGDNRLTIGGHALEAHKDYITELRLNTISVISPATEETELERVIDNLIDNENYNAFIVKVDDRLVLRVVDKNHAPSTYQWDNSKGGDMMWSALGWQNEAWYSGSDVSFESDGVAGVAGTGVTLKSAVTVNAITVSGEDDFTFSMGGNVLTANTLSKSGSGTMTVNGNVVTASEGVGITGGTVHLSGNASLSTPELQISHAALELEQGSKISATTGNSQMELDGATLINLGNTALAFNGSDETSRKITLTSTGVASNIVGKWKISDNFIYDVSAADAQALVLGGNDAVASELAINRNGFTINLGDKWDGRHSLANPIKLFEVGSNASIKLGATVLASDVNYQLGLGQSPLNSLKVNYDGGMTELTQFNNNYHTLLTYQDGALYLNIVEKGEYVWKFTDGAAMTWTKAGNWGAIAGTSEGTPYIEYEHVRFTGDADTNISSTSTIAVNAVTNTASDTDKAQNTLYIGDFVVEGEDNFNFNITGRMQMTGFTKTGSGTVTLTSENATDKYMPTFKVLDGDFTVSGGHVDATVAGLEIELGTLLVDGTQGSAKLTAKFQRYSLSNSASITLRNSDMVVTGGGATVDANMIRTGDNGGRASTLSVSQGATLNIDYLTSTKAGQLQVNEVTVSGGATINLRGNYSDIKAKTINIASGGTLALTKGTGTDFAFAADGAKVAVNLTDGGILKNARTDGKALNLNTVKDGSVVEITLTGSASVLEGDWVLDASRYTVFRYANADTSALSIRNGTLNIINAASATDQGALVFDLTNVWDGQTAITQRLFRTVTGGDLTINGNSIAAGDVTSLFNNVYVRYGTGANDIINLSSVRDQEGSSVHYQLLWQNGSLFFTLAGQDESGPYIWRHSYEQEYAPTGSTDPLQLTWSVGEVWRPASDTFGGPSGDDTIPEARYKDGKPVSFVGDTDGVVDEVLVTIAGTVAPGDSTQGEAGMRITGADNYTFTAGYVSKVEGEAVHRIEDPENPGSYIYCKLDSDNHPITDEGGHIITYDPSTVVTVKEAEIADYVSGHNAVLPTTLSKSGTGTTTIEDSVKLTYTGRTEVLEGKLHVDSLMWSPAGIISVAEGATLQVGKDAMMGTRQANVFSLGASMVDNNGTIHTNIVLPTGATITGNGLWKASYFSMADTSFHAGIIELQPLIVTGFGNASLVANGSDITVSRYFDGAGQNITLTNRSFMTVEGNRGKTASNAAVEAYNVIISGEGSGLDFTGGGTLRAEIIELSYGATLGLGKALEHVGDNAIDFTFGYGSTLRNNSSSAIVLNPNHNADFNLIVEAAAEPNYFEGNWKVDLSNPFLLDFSSFDNDTTVVPIVVRDGTMTLANANNSYNAATHESAFQFRADGLKYDTLEILTVGERGKIALSWTEQTEVNGTTSTKSYSSVLSNNSDYFSHLSSIGYWFHEDANGYDTQNIAGTSANRAAGWDDTLDLCVTDDGWRYVDLVNKGTFKTNGEYVQLTDAQFSAYTGLQQNVNFKLLYESNVLSLVIAPDGPIGDRNYYFWSGRTPEGNDYETWTRHNSTTLSPWSDGDIYQNGYLTIFADVDIHGNKVGSHTVEIENAVATGSAPIVTGRPDYFSNAGIYFGNRAVAGYTVQSDKYDGSGSITDLVTFDAKGNPVENVTKVTVEGGFVEIKTNNVYGGKSALKSSNTNFSTIVTSLEVKAVDCSGYTYTDGEGVEHVIADNTLYSMNVEEARAAHLVNYSRYTYAYQDANGEVHFITSAEYNNGTYAQYNPERVYITQRTDGSGTWSVRGNTIPMTVKNDLAPVYQTEVMYGHAYITTDENGANHVHFISGADWDSGKFAAEHAMEVILTPTQSNRISWAITGMGVDGTLFETIADSDVDRSKLSTTSSTYGFAYRDPSEDPAQNGKFRFISEQDYGLWKAWSSAEEQNKAGCYQAFHDANPALAEFAAANPGVTVEYVSVERKVNASNPANIIWSVGNDTWGRQDMHFGEMSLNQVYAYENVDGTYHVLTQAEYETWTPGTLFNGKTVEALGVFGPVDGKWTLFNAEHSAVGTVNSRPAFVATENAYLRTQEMITGYAYAAPDPASSTNHVHFIDEAQCTAWRDWANVAYNDSASQAEKDTAYDAFVAAVGSDFAQMAKGLEGVVPDKVKLNAYENEQSYRVTGSFIHDNLTNRAIANNFSYAYTTAGTDGAQEINIITADQYKAWQTWNAVDKGANASEADKAAAFEAFKTAVGETLALSIRDDAVLAPERVDLAYNAETDNATGVVTNYWNVRGDSIIGRKDTLMDHQTYGTAFAYAYLGSDGRYHTITQEQYKAWDPAAHGGAEAVRVDLTAVSTIRVNEVDNVPYADTVWVKSIDGVTIADDRIDSMEAMSGHLYSYAYNIVDSMGRTHVHFVSAEDFDNNTYATRNPLLITLTTTSHSNNYSWDVKGEGIDTNIPTRAIANNYAYAYMAQDDEGNNQLVFISASEFRSWQSWAAIDGDADPDGKEAALAAMNAASAANNSSPFAGLAAAGGISPERVDLTYCTENNGSVAVNYWQLKGATIDTRLNTLNGEYAYGCAFLYVYEDSDGYHAITAEEYANGTYANAMRVDMTSQTTININPEDGSSTASPVWTLRTENGDVLQMSQLGGMAALADKVYSYAYVNPNQQDNSLQFLTQADYASGAFSEYNPKLVTLAVTADKSYTWDVHGGAIDEIIDVSNIPTSGGDGIYTDVRTENYTYVAVSLDEFGNVSTRFISKRDYDDMPAGPAKDAIQRLVLVKQSDGKWFVPDKGYTMTAETLEVTVDVNEFFGYGYYDERGQLHLTTQDYYYGDSNPAFAEALGGTATQLGNTQLIRLTYDEKTQKWYTPGVLIASNEHALGTSEVKIGYGSRLLATTNLYLTSLTTETGANVIARGNLDINKPLRVGAESYFEVDGTLTVADITVDDNASFITHGVKAKNVTIGTGAKWDLNSLGSSVLDISDRLIIHAGAEITGTALMRDGLLELVSGDMENPYVTITGSLKLGVDATLDLTKLIAEGEGHHYSSPLRVSEGGSLVLEQHDSILLSMDQVNHLLDTHDGIEQNRHVMHIATLGPGANFYITTEQRDGDTILSSEDVLLPTIVRDVYDELDGNVHLAEGLGYMLDATLIRRNISTGADTGLDEVVLYIKEKKDNPAYIWNGVYNGYNAAGNDNLWCMFNGGELDEATGEVVTDSHAWSGGAIYGDPNLTDPDKAFQNWGGEVYFLEVGRDVATTMSTTGSFPYHYVNAGDKAENDLTYRAKYVDIKGPVWSKQITVDVDRLYDMTLDQYLRNVGYMFYSSDGTGTITDCYVDTDGIIGEAGMTYSLTDPRITQEIAALLDVQQTNIVKNGTGVLTLNTENSFSGTVYLNSGSVFATNEKALGSSHVMMQDQTSLFINFLFEMKGDSNYRNPVLVNEITVWGGENLASAAERASIGNEIISVTVGYNPISVIDVMCDLQNTTTADMKEESTSRHWRTLSIVGALHGDKNTEIKLQGYTSYTGSVWYTSMFHIYGTEDESDFAGTIKLENYRNTSPAAYSGLGSFMNDTNNVRGTGPLELMLSDGTLKYATLDLTRQNVLASYKDENGREGFGRRQTPIHIVLLQGDSAVAGLNADFLGSIVRAERDSQGAAHSGHVEILTATQAQELTCVRTIATGNYTLNLHSDENYDYVYSGMLGGKYAYAGQGSGTIPEAGEDAAGAKISNGMVSLVHTGDGAQYIHTAYLQDLTIGNEAVGVAEKATGGTVGFHYLDLQGNLTLHSGATLRLDVDDCVRTANADGSQQEVHWDESAFSSNNVVLHAGRHASVITSDAEPGTVTVYDKETKKPANVDGMIPVGSTIAGTLTVDANAYLDFYSRGIEPLCMAEGGTSPDLIKKLTDPSFHPETGVSISPPDTGFMLDITGALILKGDVHVDFAGVEFGSAENGMTYYLARAQKGIIGTVNQQTISLGNGYYGIIRGLETYNRSIAEVLLPGTVNNAQHEVAFVPSTALGGEETDVLKAMDALTAVRVYLTPVDDGSNSYYFDYQYRFNDSEEYKTDRLTLTQVTGNIYHYDVGDTSYDAVISTDLPTGGMVATLNLLDLAFADSTGYIIMTVTNTPPRVWFNTDNVIDPTREITDNDAALPNVLLTPGGTRFINDGKTGTESGGEYGNGVIGFGDVEVDTLWTVNGPDAHSWIDEHAVYGIGCRVQFNRFGTVRYKGEGTIPIVEGDEAAPYDGTGIIYTRGDHVLTYNVDRDEYGMYVTETTNSGSKEVWRGMVTHMYGEQFDIVELEGDVQARSIFVDCETGIHADDGETLLINSPRSGKVNYWFRSAQTDDAGRIGDIEVTDINCDSLKFNNVYDVKIGQVLAVTLEKTGQGFLRISTHNTYSGGTYLKQGGLIIDCADALGKASAKQEAGGGDGALHAYDGSTLYLNYDDNTSGTTVFSNNINVYANTAASAADQAAGFTVVNGINLNNTIGNVHFVELNGAIIAADPDAVITLSCLIVAADKNSFHDYTSFTLANLEKYSGVVRLDSNFASAVDGEGTWQGVGVTRDEQGNVIAYERIERTRTFYRPGADAATETDRASYIVDGKDVLSHYDEPTRTIRYFIDEKDGEGNDVRTYLSYKDTYASFGKKPTDEGYKTYTGDDVKTGGEVGLRITGNTLGDAIVDLSLNNASHNALVLDMAKATSGSNYELKGVRGLEGGDITYVTVKNSQNEIIKSGWEGYSSNVVTTKRGGNSTTKLSLDISYGDALYAGMVGYGNYHSATGSDVGLIYPSAALRIEKKGSSTQSIYSARLDGLTLSQGNIQFVKDLILSGTLDIAKESQLIIGTPGKTTWNYNTTNGAPYSIVVQGEGILALGDKHTVQYKTTDNGRTFDSSTSWSAFTTRLAEYSEDMNTNALLRGGTLTAITDVATSISATFANSFTIDTSHYDYESDILGEVGISIETEFDANHTITLKGRLFGSGTLTLTGGGTVVFDNTPMTIYDTKQKLDVGTMSASNEFMGTSKMLIRVQDDTTLSLNKDYALAYYGPGYTEQINGGKRKLVLSDPTIAYQGASTLEVTDTSRAVVENEVRAQIAAARFVQDGHMQVGRDASDEALATVSLRPASSYADIDAGGMLGGGATPVDDAETLAGSPDTLNIVNVEVASVDGKVSFTGIKENAKENSIEHNSLVVVSEGVEATMSNLTLGSAFKKGEGAEQDHSLAHLKQGASLKLSEATIQTYAAVEGEGGNDNKGYTGVINSMDLNDKELVELNKTRVVIEFGENLVTPTDTFRFTGVESGGDYVDSNTDYYTYSEHHFGKDAGQIVYMLNNFQNCVLTGGEGDLILQMSTETYERLVEEGKGGLVGFYMPGVAVSSDVVENLVSVVTVDGDSDIYTPRASVFYVSANPAMGTLNNGTVFYIDTDFVPEPTTGTLSVLALAALVARRRRKRA